mmetsp:Transcript_12301/g.31343  ORF Transcript_12301/g.31343 Transcript_12301/m.31343 type:complete len:201 (+) Transcript_12301:445-1047(+)
MKFFFLVWLCSVRRYGSSILTPKLSASTIACPTVARMLPNGRMPSALTAAERMLKWALMRKRCHMVSDLPPTSLRRCSSSSQISGLTRLSSAKKTSSMRPRASLSELARLRAHTGANWKRLRMSPGETTATTAVTGPKMTKPRMMRPYTLTKSHMMTRKRRCSASTSLSLFHAAVIPWAAHSQPRTTLRTRWGSCFGSRT